MLDKELEGCLREGPLGISLHHPLVVSVIYTPSMDEYLNTVLHFKKQAVEKALKSGEWKTYVWLHERPYRTEALLRIAALATSDKDWWQLVRDVWIDSENIWQNHDIWSRLIRADARDLFMTAKDRKVYNNLPPRVTCFRGFQAGRNEYGLSWTLSEDVAAWFAARYSSKGKVQKWTYAKDQIFAFVGGRGEEELIILPEAD